MYQPSDVVLVPFPFSDLKTVKRRPVLVIQAADHNGDMVCLAITSSSHHDLSVPIDNASLAEGILPKPSWVRYGKVFTLNESITVGRFGTLKPEPFDLVIQHFCRHFGC
jgi:mRNA interferase MazF